MPGKWGESPHPETEETRGPLCTAGTGVLGADRSVGKGLTFLCAGFSAAFSLLSAFFSPFGLLLLRLGPCGLAAGLAGLLGANANEIGQKAARQRPSNGSYRSSWMWACLQACLCDGPLQQGLCIYPLVTNLRIPEMARAVPRAAGAFRDGTKSPQFHSHGRRVVGLVKSMRLARASLEVRKESRAQAPGTPIPSRRREWVEPSTA